MNCLQLFKCGDLMLVKKFSWVINFKCDYCDEVMDKLESFLKHTLKHLIDIEDANVSKLIDDVLPENYVNKYIVDAKERVIEIPDNNSYNKAEGAVLKMEECEEHLNQSFEELSIDLLLHEANVHTSTINKETLQNIYAKNTHITHFEGNEYNQVLTKDFELEPLDGSETLEYFDIELYDEEKANEHITESDEHVKVQTEFKSIDITDKPTKRNKRKKVELRDKISICPQIKSKITEDNNELHICSHCNKHFFKLRCLKRHLLIHSTQKPYTCDYCDASFADRGNYNVHRRRHLGINPHSCKICNKGFPTTTDLNNHMRSHTDLRPFVCDVCGITYKSKQQLERHINRLHSNIRNFSCDVCEKKFYDKKMLNEHYVSHTDERPFKCEICAKSFRRKKALVQHLKLHSDVYEYPCSYCEKAFQQRPGLLSHIKNVHKK